MGDRDCRCGISRRARLCEPCAERQFDKLAASSSQDDDVQDGEEIPTIIRPSPQGREGKEGYHQRNDEEDDASSEERRKAKGIIPGSRRSAIITDTPPANRAWRCPRCGPLNRLPLAGDDGKYHCLSLDCDSIVE